jgi:CheY-like chemotaxis protein
MASKSILVLVVEDDAYIRHTLCQKLGDRGLDTIEASNEADAIKALEEQAADIKAAVLDMCVPEAPGQLAANVAGPRSIGLRLARVIRKTYPHIRLVGTSFFAEEEVQGWFAQYGYRFLPKTWLTKASGIDFVDVVEQAARRKFKKPKPRTFIVHGHDTQLLYELTHFIERSLDWPRPTILRELPSLGRTIIEKFEDATQHLDLAFVLLTPDDHGHVSSVPNDLKRRARQNVIFELGYFFAKLQRSGGRVITLFKGDLDLPSDISGIVFIDVSNGVAAAGEELRKELSPWM